LNRRIFIKSSAAAALWSLILSPSLISGLKAAEQDLPLTPIAKPDPARWKNDEINVAWIGHATVLINFYGKIILTDPVFYESVGLYLGGYTLGPKRASMPAIEIYDIPKPDIVLISHAHMDHMDYRTLKKLTEMYPSQLDCITAFNTQDVIEDLNWKSLQELDWDEELNFKGIRFKGVEVKHHGWRYPGEKDRSAGFFNDGRSFNAYIMEMNNKKILFGGDTTFTDKLKKHKHENVDIAIMPIGAYKPWRKYHCTPEEALVMAEYHLGAKHFIPMHTKTFDSDDMIFEPLIWLMKSKKHYNINVGIKDIGETFTLKT
jgi:L-ascorbate metabolism protein UlaG (beta-lactamase superfamily)